MTWWRDAVTYQIYPRSFADASGDGVGDLPGITSRLDHVADLGVDAIWLSPMYPSPMADAGYDVANYRDVDPLFGTLADLDALFERADDLGLKVLLDVVPNHTSDEHPWFEAALAAPPGSMERERYLFRPGRGPSGEEPPNNWRSVFGGPAWTRVIEADGTPGEWYLHLFDVKQPDLNWENTQVRDEFHAILRFWLDRGVAGFRIDVAHGLVKAEGLPDDASEQRLLDASPGEGTDTASSPMWDQEGVHEIYRGWRTVVDEYDNPERVLCAEAWVEPPERLMRYLRPDELHQAFSFDFLTCAWRAGDLVSTVTEMLRHAQSVGAPPTWVLSNHDVVRHATRLGYPVGTPRPHGIGAQDPQPDAQLGLRRARAATTLMLALPGSAYLYQGEELGLPEHTTLPDSLRQDPAFLRTGGAEIGRDGCRVPLPWTKGAPGSGFSPSGATWLPQPAAYDELAADAQRGVAGSTLDLYRRLLRVRRDRGLGRRDLRWADGYPEDVFAAWLVRDDAPDVLVLVNLGAVPIAIPVGAEVLVSSEPLHADVLPTDVAVWLSSATDT